MGAKKKQEATPDWHQVAQSMHKDSKTLYEKLKAIWDLAHEMIKFVDENHPKPIKKVLRQNKAMFGKSSSEGVTFGDKRNDLKDFVYATNAHYVTLHRLHKDYEDSLIAESYFKALGTLSHIQTKTNFIARYFHECRKSNVNTIEFIEKILSVDTQVPHTFMNEVLPLFFSLQLHCYNLVEIANRPAGAPADPRVRRSRSTAGGKSKNYGEHVLKGMILDLIVEQNPEQKHINVSALFGSLEKELRKILDEYLGLLGSPIEKGGMPLSYGEKPELTIHGIPRKLHQWKNKDPEFRKRLERICILR